MRIDKKIITDTCVSIQHNVSLLKYLFRPVVLGSFYSKSGLYIVYIQYEKGAGGVVVVIV